MNLLYVLRWKYVTALFFSMSLVPAIADAEIVEWMRQFGTSEDDFGEAISIDSLGDIYVAGSTRGSLAASNADGTNGFLIKFDAAGAIKWERQWGNNYSFGKAVTASQPGSVYVSGFTGDDLAAPIVSGEDAYLIRYDDNGNRLWTRQIGTTASDRSYSVTADATNTFIGGWTSGSLGGTKAGSSDSFVSKYNTNGELQWSRQLGTSARDERDGVSADGVGNVYFAGFTEGNLNRVNNGSLDGFVGKYDAAGTLVWIRQLGTSGTEYINSVSADGLGNVYFSGFVELGPVRFPTLYWANTIKMEIYYGLNKSVRRETKQV